MRYLDPDAPALGAVRMKELRYMRKVEALDDWGMQRAYADEADDKLEGKLPVFQGDPEVGLLSDWGWQLQGYIEDAGGALAQIVVAHLITGRAMTNAVGRK